MKYNKWRHEYLETIQKNFRKYSKQRNIKNEKVLGSLHGRLEIVIKVFKTYLTF